MHRIALLAVVVGVCNAATPIRGTKCAPNQAINRITVYEDGALEAECGPLPCGNTGPRCIDNQASCRADTDVFSGMAWAPNGQSVLLRCCTLKVPKKIYVGTDLVSSGSYYVGGAVAEKDRYGSGGEEYDFVANIRTEQGGVRVWVYRAMCEKNPAAVPNAVAPVAVAPSAVAPDTVPIGGAPQALTPEERRKALLARLSGRQSAQEEEEEFEGEEEEEEEDTQTYNPLRFRPADRQSSGVHRH